MDGPCKNKCKSELEGEEYDNLSYEAQSKIQQSNSWLSNHKWYHSDIRCLLFLLSFVGDILLLLLTTLVVFMPRRNFYLIW